MTSLSKGTTISTTNNSRFTTINRISQITFCNLRALHSKSSSTFSKESLISSTLSNISIQRCILTHIGRRHTVSIHISNSRQSGRAASTSAHSGYLAISKCTNRHICPLRITLSIRTTINNLSITIRPRTKRDLTTTCGFYCRLKLRSTHRRDLIISITSRS